MASFTHLVSSFPFPSLKSRSLLMNTRGLMLLSHCQFCTTSFHHTFYHPTPLAYLHPGHWLCRAAEREATRFSHNHDSVSLEGAEAKAAAKIEQEGDERVLGDGVIGTCFDWVTISAYRVRGDGGLKPAMITNMRRDRMTETKSALCWHVLRRA